MPDDAVKNRLDQVLETAPGVCGDFLGRTFTKWFGFDLTPAQVARWIVERYVGKMCFFFCDGDDGDDDI